MKGFGSGYHRDRGARRCEDMLSLDMSTLRRLKYLTPGTRRTIHWSLEGERVASIEVVAEVDGIRLIYSTTNASAHSTPIDEFIRYTYTDTNFGGRRCWLVCPFCGRRCRIVYGGKLFHCRDCHGLTYNSQYQLGWERAESRVTKIIRRLGGYDWEDDFFPKKPKGMHWSTYQKFRDEYDWYNGGRLPTITEWRNL